MKQTQTRKKYTKKGMTLVEILVALLIFSFVATIASGIFVSGYRTYYESKVVQRNMEDANYAMGLVMKILRTSTVLTGAGNNLATIQVFDNSQSRCFLFTFDGSQLEIQQTDVVADKAACAAATYSSNYLSSGKIAGRFRMVRPSNNNNAQYRIGAVTVVMEIGDTADTNDVAYLQSTVSLRDYSEVNP